MSEHFRDAPSEADAALEDSECRADLLDQAIQLQPKAKVALIRKLISQLETESIQTVLEFGLREIGDRHRRSTPSATVSHNTRLLLKKDYSYHARGLSEPTQYYVYLRRRKPKLDRYIGTLFYIPQGCVLSYFLDAEGRIIFNPPHNVFQLRDSTNSAVVQIVRLICLEPPPPDYTFTKQQNDTPAIHLHLEYLDPKTYQPIAKQTYPFPVCMYEGGRLDRYRWEVSTVALPPEQSLSRPHLVQTSVAEPLLDTAALPPVSSTDCSPPDRGLPTPPNQVAQPTRRILELPATTGLTFYLSDRTSSDAILKRMRLWVAWSEKAMPRSRWEIVQDGAIYTLLNARFKRRILKFSSDRASVTLEHPLPVLMKWFHDLSLAVSQAPNQKPYSAAQLKLAHNLFVDTSLTQEDPLVALKQLFGVDFSKTSNDRA
ncbi:hypothetical protein H6F43_08275 [Leptolyngbya sp. FACHB-36]|uniref:hypothetical protein n=1 Tax=Leptolyngbya sp. FACHB-36 TaxID=2692808 RepID=UPI0016818512|nr:hypothetical protein [Leptolyngbya sp. FACHB-36]MBD2020181.1 hypothetical protein [Leptolyngbya sp. FACHB-36]